MPTHTCVQLDDVKRKREERIREDIRVNGPRWVPEINRHFMDADNSTSDFGPCLSLVPLRQYQKRPMDMRKETYIRGLPRLSLVSLRVHVYQKRPVDRAKETYVYGKRDLNTRPTTPANATRLTKPCTARAPTTTKRCKRPIDTAKKPLSCADCAY